MLNIDLHCSNVMKFYEFYVEVLNCLSKLANKEKELLKVLLFIYYNNRTNLDVDKLLLSTETRKTIKDYLKISEANLNNLISNLKKKKLIKNDTIVKEIINYPGSKNKTLSITFNLMINDR